MKLSVFHRGKIYYFSVLFAVVLWVYRLERLHSSILYGQLPDFHKLFFAARALVQGGDSQFIATSSYGPPIIYVPYLPLTPLSFKSAEFAITYISLFSYVLVFYLFWRRYYTKLSAYFWFFLGVLAFCFPIIYSLGMGNPIGIVVLGIYSFFIFKRGGLSGVLYGIASMMKLFPLIMLPFLAFKSKFSKFIVPFIGVCVVILLFVPEVVWLDYTHFFINLMEKVSGYIDLTAYNQSFSSGISRLGVKVYTFSLVYWIWAFVLVLILCSHTLRLLRKGMGFGIEFYMFLLAFTLLIHPFPWQYYYAIFIPFLMVKVYKGSFLYLVVFLLLSLDGNRVHLYPLLDNFLLGSQFYGTLLFFLLVGLRQVKEEDKKNILLPNI